MNPIVMLPVELIDESPFNPAGRTSKDLVELTNSIRAKGILQPVRARPVSTPAGDRYELVFGHRRVRAARAAGLQEVPATVSALTDKEVLEEQLVENNQREDVHPIEEAEGMQRLVQDHGYSVERLAEKLGKSKAHVYARLKLCELGKQGRKLCLEGKITPGVALIIARIPVPELREKAAEELAKWAREYDEPISVARAAEHVQREYMLELSRAQFDLADATLVPDAGPCTKCPKRTGNQRELFADVKSPDVCTDPPCFAKKQDALWKLKVDQAKKAGQKVLPAAEAKKVVEQARYGVGSGLVDIDTRSYSDPKQRTYRELLAKAKDAPTAVLARDEDGRVVELVEKKALAKVVKTAAPAAQRSDETQKWREEEKARARLDAALREAVCSKAQQEWTPDQFRYVALLVADSYSARDALRRRKVSIDDPYAWVEKQELDVLRGFIVDALIGPGNDLVEAAKAFGVNVTKVKAQVAKAAPEKKKAVAR